MSKKTYKRQRDLKTKLMAAISMLLVSSLMLVTSTYAWFTLSTAPEVTGITTAVGANGNLEMALLPETGDTEDITSMVGDSMYDGVKDVKGSNITWGNLVDLSDNTIYGLEEITLFPSSLNVDGGKIGAALLKTPEYGADGRVSRLDENTTTGVFDKTSSSFTPDALGTTTYGVRAIGTASGMTDRQLDYRNASSAANTARTQAASIAAGALNSNGSALANIAIQYGMKGSTAEFGKEDLVALRGIIDALQNEDGVFDTIERSYMQYILAYGASEVTGDADTAWQGVKSLVNNEGATLATVVEGLADFSVTLDSTVQGYIDDYNDMVSSVTAADTELKKLEAEVATDPNAKFSWEEIKIAMTPLVDPTAMEINGFKASEVKEKLGDLVSSVTAQGGLKVIMKSGAGVFADIADHTEDYFASVNIEKVDYNGIVLNNMAARMETDSDEAPNYFLVKLGEEVRTAGAPADGGQGARPITDMYGYVIDLAFRTNAADSTLLLQSEAVDRIYSDNSNEDTMGHGATMTFKATTTDFSNDQVKDLMDAIRIVFFETASQDVIANAKLDVANATFGTEGWTAEIRLYEVTEGTAATYEQEDYVEGSNKIYYTRTGTTKENYTVSENPAGAGVQLYTKEGETYTEATYAADSDLTYYIKNTVTEYEYTKADNPAEAEEGTLYVEKAATAGQEVLKQDNKIMPLTQNDPHKLSVLVYLDGNKVTNGSVAATASTSMTGSMNLQFASSATLIPMEYADLHQPTVATELKSISVEGETGASGKGSFDTSGNVTINLTGISDTNTVTKVTVDGTEVENPAYADGKLTFKFASIKADSTVIITAGSATP